MNKIQNSIVADNGSSIKNSKNDNSLNYIVKKARRESAIISFIVGTVSSIAASYIYEHFFK